VTKQLIKSVRKLFIVTKSSSFDLARELESEMNRVGFKLFKEEKWPVRVS
jgi:hypothetical protein